MRDDIGKYIIISAASAPMFCSTSGSHLLKVLEKPSGTFQVLFGKLAILQMRKKSSAKKLWKDTTEETQVQFSPLPSITSKTTEVGLFRKKCVHVSPGAKTMSSRCVDLY